MLFNQILNPRLVSPLVRIFGMKTGANPAPTLAPEVQPSIDVNQQDDAAAYFIRRSKLFSSMFFNSAIAGQYSEFQLRNPVNSGVLLVVKRVMVSATTFVAMGVRTNTTDYATIITSSSVHDSRWLSVGGGTSRAAIVSAQTNAAPLLFGGLGAVNNDVNDLMYVVAPGTSLNGYVTAVNVQAIVGLLWEERPIAPEELATG